MSVAIVAFGALSGLGRGEDAFSSGPIGSTARVATVIDEELRASGLGRPFCARAANLEGEGDRAKLVLAEAMSACTRALDEVLPEWRSKRIGLALGTSSGGMRSAETLFRVIANNERPSPEQARQSAYFSPMSEVVAETGLFFSPSTLVLTACAASTIAIGVGMRWLARSACDIVLAGGFDAVSVFVASGFEALRATTTQLPSRPFGKDRDGMALGEGAAVLALMRNREAPRALAYFSGFGASGDAVHVTAPDRTGDGLARAAKMALAEASCSSVDLVSAHGTATPFNDAAESRAIASALGAQAAETVVHPFKAQIGHTLGAAGALESLACVDAIMRGALPASAIGAERDPEAPARLLGEVTASVVTRTLKLSAAFGGANAALVIDEVAKEGQKTAAREVYASHAVHVDAAPSLAEVASLTGQPPDRLAKTCDVSRLALAAIARLTQTRHLSLEDLKGAGIVVGHAYATLDINEEYNRRILDRGARFVEPRKFPYTSPNASAGECSVAFRLTGPNLAVGSGLHGGLEALAIAWELVHAGDADRIVVVAVDAPGLAARLVSECAGWPLPPMGAVALLVSSTPIAEGWVLGEVELASHTTAAAVAPGHLALLPLCTPASSARLVSVSPDGGFARVTASERVSQ